MALATHQGDVYCRKPGQEAVTINSNQKGKTFEREVAGLFRKRGWKARRGQQFSGLGDSPDVVVEDAPWLWIEAKRTERLRIYPAIEQAVGDAGENQVPVVIHRSSQKETLVTMRFEDWFEMFMDHGFARSDEHAERMMKVTNEQ